MTRIIAVALASIALLFALPAPDAVADPVTEDDPAWDCRTMGDQVCGPHNSQGLPPGLYDAQGRLVSPWPTITTCTLPPGALFDVCDAYYVDPRFVHLQQVVAR
jgi:hypothetical protein